MPRRIYLLLGLLFAASLACTLTAADDTTPTPGPNIQQISDLETATATARPSDTPVPAAPTRLPTLIPTPVQFEPAPVRPGGTTGGSTGGTTGGSTGGGGNVPSAEGLIAPGAATGAPSAGGFYYPQSIIYRSGNSVMTINADGGGARTLGGGGTVARSLNGLYVGLGGNVVTPGGATVGGASGQTTLPTWSPDGGTAYYGAGNRLMRIRGGVLEEVDSLGGDLINVQYAPEGGTVAYATPNIVRTVLGDGSLATQWEGDRLTFGPVWAYRNGNLGLYIEVSDGSRIFLGEGGGTINDGLERLQLVNPTDQRGRVFQFSDSEFIVQWPGAADILISVSALQNISWEPNGPRFVYANTGGALVVVDATTGAERAIGQGASAPIWSPQLYRVQR